MNPDPGLPDLVLLGGSGHSWKCFCGTVGGEIVDC